MTAAHETTPEEATLLADLGIIFAKFRSDARLTQRQAALLGSSTQARVSDLELGKKDMMLSTLQHWARVYGYHLELSFVPIEEEADENASVSTEQHFNDVRHPNQELQFHQSV